jgi:hypothetical protein
MSAPEQMFDLIDVVRVEPLRDPAYFARVFLDDGILTWPNGFDPSRCIWK